MILTSKTMENDIRWCAQYFASLTVEEQDREIKALELRFEDATKEDDIARIIRYNGLLEDAYLFYKGEKS